jgi:hypothetical protein
MRVALMVIGVAFGISSGTPTLFAETRDQFDRGITRYLVLRRSVEQRVPGPRVSTDLAEIHSAADAQADAIRSARPRAKQGDIFTAKVAADFRRHIRAVLTIEGLRPDQLAERRDDERGRPLAPAVNGRFDWNLNAVMPAVLIAALPPLPSELQYRFVERDLVLVDIVAGLVVDILPHALID